MNDDALPVERALYLVHLECHPRVVEHRRQLGARAGAAHDPVAGERVADRLDVDTIVKREGHAADAVSAKQSLALVLGQRAQARFAVGRHTLTSDLGSSTSTATGMVNENVLPDPTSLSTQMRPPCASTMPLAMERPSPVPRLTPVAPLWCQ